MIVVDVAVVYGLWFWGVVLVCGIAVSGIFKCLFTFCHRLMNLFNVKLTHILCASLMGVGIQKMGDAAAIRHLITSKKSIINVSHQFLFHRKKRILIRKR